MSKLMSIRVVAPTLNMAEITLRRLIRKREIPFHRIGHRYFFTEENINEYLSKTAVPMKGTKS